MRRARLLPEAIVSALVLAAGCRGRVHFGEAADRLVFLRGAVLVPNKDGDAFPQGLDTPVGRLVEREWHPGETVRLGGFEGVAPDLPECRHLFDVDLGQASSVLVRGGEPPDADVAWSPDGRTLAAGSARGEILVVDALMGRVLARRRLSEAVVKDLAFSPDGRTLYAGEQSPDAWLYALDPATLETRWSRRLADEVESSAPPPSDDLYGLYTLPAVYGLQVLPDGELLVAAVHAWNVSPSVRKNRSRLILFDDEGRFRAAWPPGGAADATLMHPHADAGSDGRGLVVVPVGRSASGPAPPDLPIGGVKVLSLPDLTPAASFVAEPLKPWFSSVFAWDAVAVDRETGSILLGLGDGRVYLATVEGLAAGLEPVRVDLATPVLAGNVPIVASVGFGLLHPAHAGNVEAVVVTARTNIPYGSTSAAMRPPAVHPDENTLSVLRSDGSLRWAWHGPPVLTGLGTGPDGHTLVAGAGPRASDDRDDLFGALLFDLGSDETGPSFTTFCASDSPAILRQELSVSGFLAFPVHPYVRSTGELLGRYAVEVFR
jgi:hypothetical protein